MENGETSSDTQNIEIYLENLKLYDYKKKSPIKISPRSNLKNEIRNKNLDSLNEAIEIFKAFVPMSEDLALRSIENYRIKEAKKILTAMKKFVEVIDEKIFVDKSLYSLKIEELRNKLQSIT
uniref:Uncharacterized protein n=1 Tax=Pithovirus LCPAC104 TaxID=2506589 RepID=A0A481Z5Z0_9VIRU|nr:MAG: hypothetical protein LCPAC104_00350 [Pithovirus LCPAC104]